MIVIRPPTERDIVTLAANMREIDALECRVVGEHEPIDALREGVRESSWSYAVEVDGELICIFGLAPFSLLSDEASPWLLCAEGIERHARTVVTYANLYKPRMLAEFSFLANVVHASNRSAIRFLRWCGFSFGDQIEIGGEPFLKFTMGAQVLSEAA